MAAAPPYDLLVQKAPGALNLLETQLFKLTKKLSERITVASAECNKMPKTISCQDPQVIAVKQKLEDIQRIVQKIADVLRIVNIVYITCVALARTSLAYVAYRQTIPTPVIPADNEFLNATKEVAAFILEALKKIKIVVGIIDISVLTSLGALAEVINLLSSICQNEDFVVFSATQDVINIKSIANINMSQLDIPPSDFYQNINVSEDDIKSRADAAETLLTQQRTLLDLLEAPSRVITLTGQNAPLNNVGKAGDFAINTQTYMIYGPKPSDSIWNEGVKY
jgi:hypothetical protein